MGTTRRQFLRRSALATGSVLGMPYLLPTGTAFAKTGQRRVEHVVVVLFAGGVRQQETVLQRYLADSQGIDIEGNVLSNLLEGAAPDDKVVFGTQTAGSVPIPKLLNTTLESQGLLLPEMNFSGGSTGHYSGLSAALSGHYSITQGLRQRPVRPTMFEYVRRHTDASATDVWFVGNGIGGAVPLLNYSASPDYGAPYGANMFISPVTFGDPGQTYARDGRIFHPEEELPAIQQMRQFLDLRFGNPEGSELALDRLGNTPAEKLEIKNFVRETYARLEGGLVEFPPVTDNGDTRNIGFATEVMRHFQPKLTVVNLGAADTCHDNYTNYLQALHRADHGIAFLWDYIQTRIPAMADNTALLIVPEHGRNLNPNGITDVNDWVAFDHDSDANSRRVFGMLAAPGVDAGLRLGSEGNPVGDVADVVMTVGDLLGIKPQIEQAGHVASVSRSWLDRI